MPAKRLAGQAAALLRGIRPDAPLVERLDELETIARWVRPGSTLGLRLQASASTARLRLVVQSLREDPAATRAFRGLVSSVLSECSGYAFFCETGTGRVGFFAEALHRFSSIVLPAAPDHLDLGALLLRLFPTPGDAAWVETVPSDLVAELVGLLDDEAPTSLFAPALDAMADALRVVALRAAARGFADDIRARMPAGPVRDSPFLPLAAACDALVSARAGPPEDLRAARATLHTQVAGCRKALRAAFANLEVSGVSVDLVYRLELIQKNLGRIEALADILAATVAGPRPVLDLVAALLRESHDSRSLTGLLRATTHQLARKIVERAGSTGEHYITTTRAEYFEMMRSAAGGGALTSFTAAIKYSITEAHLPLFFEMAFASANYAGSFLLMQALGLTLATKQPAMTAAALAGSIEESSGAGDTGPVTALVARLGRSQIAAVIGNVVVVIPAAFALDSAVNLLRGHHVLDVHTAEHVFQSLDPLASLTVPFAILTGFLLWLSSVAAGGLENWAVYRRLPEAIAGDRRLCRLLGPERARALAEHVRHHIAGVGGNVAAGVLLGVTAGWGKFFGAPLDVRHVTLSTGALTLAAASVGPDKLMEAGLPAALAGIVLIGLLNVGVSFYLALEVALRARDVRHEGRLFRAVLGRFLRSPREFLAPPPTTVEPAAPPSH